MMHSAILEVAGLSMCPQVSIMCSKQRALLQPRSVFPLAVRGATDHKQDRLSCCTYLMQLVLPEAVQNGPKVRLKYCLRRGAPTLIVYQGVWLNAVMLDEDQKRLV